MPRFRRSRFDISFNDCLYSVYVHIIFGPVYVDEWLPRVLRLITVSYLTVMIFEPSHGKTNNLPRRKPRRRSAELRSNCEADQGLCFRYSDRTVPLLL